MAPDDASPGRTAVDRTRSARPNTVASLLVLVPGLAAVGWAGLAVDGGEPWWHGPLDVVLVLVPAAIGAGIAAHRPRNPLGWLLLAFGSATAVSGLLSTWAATHPTTASGTWAAWGDAVLWAFGPPLLPLIGLLCPDGRPVGAIGRWGTWLGSTAVAVVALTSALAPGPLAGHSSSPGPHNPLGVAALARLVPGVAAVALVLLVGAAVLALLSVALRWRRGVGTERLAMAAAGAPFTAAVTLHLAAQITGLDALAVAGTLSAALGLPVGIGLGIARYRADRLDLFIARSQAYALLALALVVVFGATSAGAALLSGGRTPLTVAMAVAVTALASASARRRVTVAVQRAVLGAAGDPARLAADVGARLARVHDPDRIPACAVSAVTDLLHVPARLVPPGEAGPPASSLIQPLSQHGVSLGELAVPATVSPARRRALRAVAGPIATALYAATLTETVRRSRAELLTAVEEERRRLRRELHDGLGPQLAVLAMGLDAAQNRARQADSPELAALLSRLRGQADQMLGGVRQIVSGLRPPALDELGLPGALQRYAEEVAVPNGFSVEIVAGDLEKLPAAVEVAAYRIAAEALLNAVRHSGGSRCRLALTGEGQDGLCVEVTDDGTGRDDAATAGVGTQSMRERAAAVGGWVVCGPAAGGGTAVRAWLPTVAA
ncbi:sensor histidine kinase [Geodermatophilus sp. SYSU D00691]